MILVVALCLLAFSLLCLLYPRWHARQYGADAWYFLAAAEEMRRRPRWELVLPYFMLDIPQQWYPPGFTALLALFSAQGLRRWFWLINPVLDSLHLALLLGVAAMLLADWRFLLLAGLLYRLSPTLIDQYSNLNSRGIGSILFSGLMLGLAAAALGRPWGYAVAVVMVAALCLTHKLTLQAFFGVALLGTLVHPSILWLPVLLAGVALAWMVSGGFYWKVLKGHWDILRFWRRNLHRLGAHQVFHSPLPEYARDGCDAGLSYPPGLAGWTKLVRFFIGNSWLLLALPLLFLFPSPRPIFQFLSFWAWSVYLVGFVVTFAPPLRFLGEGYKYLKLAYFPMALCLAEIALRPGLPWWTDGWILAVLLLNLRSCWRLTRAIRNEKLMEVGRQFGHIFDYLKGQGDVGVLCLPVHSADAVAYHTGKRVFWGAHSAGFEKIEPFFPVLKMRVEEYFRQYPLDYLLLLTDYAPPEHLGLSPDEFVPVLEQPPYVLYHYRRRGDGKARTR